MDCEFFRWYAVAGWAMSALGWAAFTVATWKGVK